MIDDQNLSKVKVKLEATHKLLKEARADTVQAVHFLVYSFPRTEMDSGGKAGEVPEAIMAAHREEEKWKGKYDREKTKVSDEQKESEIRLSESNFPPCCSCVGRRRGGMVDEARKGG